MAVSIKRRFVILERDGFRCRYCGRSGDQGAVLEIDHIHPRSKGGTDDEYNLVTACWDCNHGKGVKVLRPVPKKRYRPRFVSVAPRVDYPDPDYEVGTSCPTPLRIALVGRFMRLTSYGNSYRYIKRIMPDALLPPQRLTDRDWWKLVDSRCTEYGRLGADMLDAAIRGSDPE